MIPSLRSELQPVHLGDTNLQITAVMLYFGKFFDDKEHNYFRIETIYEHGLFLKPNQLGPVYLIYIKVYLTGIN